MHKQHPHSIIRPFESLPLIHRSGMTQICSVYEGCCLVPALRRFDIGGGNATRYLSRLLRGRGYSFESNAELELVRDVKHASASVSINPINLFDMPVRFPPYT